MQFSIAEPATPIPTEIHIGFRTEMGRGGYAILVEKEAGLWRGRFLSNHIEGETLSAWLANLQGVYQGEVVAVRAFPRTTGWGKPPPLAVTPRSV